MLKGKPVSSSMSSCRFRAETLARQLTRRLWPCAWGAPTTSPVHRRDDEDEFFDAPPTPTEENGLVVSSFMHDSTDVFYDVSEQDGLFMAGTSEGLSCDSDMSSVEDDARLFVHRSSTPAELDGFGGCSTSADLDFTTKLTVGHKSPMGNDAGISANLDTGHKHYSILGCNDLAVKAEISVDRQQSAQVKCNDHGIRTQFRTVGNNNMADGDGNIKQDAVDKCSTSSKLHVKEMNILFDSVANNDVGINNELDVCQCGKPEKNSDVQDLDVEQKTLLCNETDLNTDQEQVCKQSNDVDYMFRHNAVECQSDKLGDMDIAELNCKNKDIRTGLEIVHNHNASIDYVDVNSSEILSTVHEQCLSRENNCTDSGYLESRELEELEYNSDIVSINTHNAFSEPEMKHSTFVLDTQTNVFSNCVPNSVSIDGDELEISEISADISYFKQMAISDSVLCNPLSCALPQAIPTAYPPQPGAQLKYDVVLTNDDKHDDILEVHITMNEFDSSDIVTYDDGGKFCKIFSVDPSVTDATASYENIELNIAQLNSEITLEYSFGNECKTNETSEPCSQDVKPFAKHAEIEIQQDSTNIISQNDSHFQIQNVGSLMCEESNQMHFVTKAMKESDVTHENICISEINKMLRTNDANFYLDSQTNRTYQPQEINLEIVGLQEVNDDMSFNSRTSYLTSLGDEDKCNCLAQPKDVCKTNWHENDENSSEIPSEQNKMSINPESEQYQNSLWSIQTDNCFVDNVTSDDFNDLVTCSTHMKLVELTDSRGIEENPLNVVTTCALTDEIQVVNKTSSSETPGQSDNTFNSIQSCNRLIEVSPIIDTSCSITTSLQSICIAPEEQQGQNETHSQATPAYPDELEQCIQESDQEKDPVCPAVLVQPSTPPATSKVLLDLCEEDRPQLLRSTSLKTGKTPPGTPSKKKMVRFADVLGLDLEDVRHIMTSDLPHIPASAYQHLRLRDKDAPIVHLSKSNHTTEGSTVRIPRTRSRGNFSVFQVTPVTSECNPPWGNNSQRGASGYNAMQPQFDVPGRSADFISKVRKTGISLESVIVSEQTVQGTCRVMNWGYEKKVTARCSTDDWKSYSDIEAAYVPNSSDGVTDGFAFSVFLTPGQTELRLALRFFVNGTEYWDNNAGSDYRFGYQGNGGCSAPAESDASWSDHFW